MHPSCRWVTTNSYLKEGRVELNLRKFEDPEPAWSLSETKSFPASLIAVHLTHSSPNCDACRRPSDSWRYWRHSYEGHVCRKPEARLPSCLPVQLPYLCGWRVYSRVSKGKTFLQGIYGKKSHFYKATNWVLAQQSHTIARTCKILSQLGTCYLDLSYTRMCMQIMPQLCKEDNYRSHKYWQAYKAYQSPTL